MDGYHVSHDPAKPSTKEATTGRELNILDVPSSSSASPTASDVAKGRPLSTSQIKCPKPNRPYETRHIYEHPTADDLARRFAETNLSDDDEESLSSSPPSSTGSSLSSRSGTSSPSSASSMSDYSAPGTPSCTCERYGITRKGDRVKLDCGGSRCGYSDSDCSSDEEDEEEVAPRSSRRHGIVVRR